MFHYQQTLSVAYHFFFNCDNVSLASFSNFLTLFFATWITWNDALLHWSEILVNGAALHRLPKFRKTTFWILEEVEPFKNVRRKWYTIVLVGKFAKRWICTVYQKFGRGHFEFWRKWYTIVLVGNFGKRCSCTIYQKFGRGHFEFFWRKW